MGRICQPIFLHFHGKLDSLLFEIHTQHLYFNNITDTDNFQRMLDVAAKLKPITYDPVNNKYIALGAIVGNAFSDGLKLKK